MQRLIQILVACVLAGNLLLGGLIAWVIWTERPVLQTTLATVQSTAAKQATNLDLELQETRKATADIHDLVIHTDLSLNGTRSHPGVLPQVNALVVKAQGAVETLNSSIAQQNDALLASQKDLQANLTALLKNSQQLQQVLVDADAVVTDPQVKELLADLDTNMKQLNLMLQSGTATAEDVRRVADKFAETYTKARNIYYAIFKEVLSIGSQGVQFVLKK